jgi:hypothetical protein
MASTFSPSLKLELIGDGDQSGIWGQTTNTNLGTLLEQAITGVVAITMVDANYTLTSFNGVSDESRNAVLVVGGTNNAVRDIIAPLVEKLYVVKNSTSGGYAVNIRASSGSSVSVPNGATVWVYCDGTNFNPIGTESIGNFDVNGNLTVSGTTTLTGALGGSTATFSGAISSVSPAFTGVPTAPTAANATSTTQIATTAFVNSAVTIATGSLGTMSTQNANNVSITGGSITGITDLAVADGGTGASSFAANNVLLGNGTSAFQVVAPSTSGFALRSTGSSWSSQRLGLGMTGETWQNTTGSRSFNVTYTNSYGYPIQVAMSLNLPPGGGYDIVCNGVAVGRDANTANVRTNCSFIVPVGGTYSVNGTGSIFYWNELY